MMYEHRKNIFCWMGQLDYKSQILSICALYSLLTRNLQYIYAKEDTTSYLTFVWWWFNGFFSTIYLKYVLFIFCQRNLYYQKIVYTFILLLCQLNLMYDKNSIMINFDSLTPENNSTDSWQFFLATPRPARVFRRRRCKCVNWFVDWRNTCPPASWVHLPWRHPLKRLAPQKDQ